MDSDLGSKLLFTGFQLIEKEVMQDGRISILLFIMKLI